MKSVYNTPCSQVSRNVLDINVGFLRRLSCLFISLCHSGLAENLFVFSIGVDGWTQSMMVESNVVLLALPLSVCRNYKYCMYLKCFRK